MTNLEIKELLSLTDEKLLVLMENEGIQKFEKLLYSYSSEDIASFINIFRRIHDLSSELYEKITINLLKTCSDDKLVNLFESGMLEYIYGSDRLKNALIDKDSKLFTNLVYLHRVKSPDRINHRVTYLFYRIRGGLGTPVTDICVAEALIRNYGKEYNLDALMRAKMFYHFTKEDFLTLIQSETIHFVDDFIEYVGNLFDDIFHEYRYERNALQALFDRSDRIPQKFYEEVRKRTPHILERRILETIKSNDRNKIFFMLDCNMLNFVQREEIMFLLTSEHSEFFNTLIDLSQEGNSFNMSEYFSSFDAQIKSKILPILEKKNTSGMVALINLRLIESIDDFELKKIFYNPKLNLSETIKKIFLENVIWEEYESIIDLSAFLRLLYRIYRDIDENYILELFKINEKEYEEEAYVLYFSNVLSGKDVNGNEDLIEFLKILDSKHELHFIKYKGKVFVATTWLTIENEEIEDISHLDGLSQVTNLQQLRLVKNNISEISGLNNLTNLKELDLSGNKIIEIEGLKHLKKLERLDLRNNRINNIKAMENLENLSYLEIGKNKLTDLKGLDNLNKLFYISISDNNITELTSLTNLTELQTLYAGRNNIKRISGLENCISLKSLDLGENEITKIEGLENVPNLTYLRLAHNNIERIENLEDLTNLEDLRLSSNKISELRGLENLKNLETVSLGDNPLSLEIIQRLTSFKKGTANPLDGFVNDAQVLVTYCRDLKEKKIENN